VAELAGEHRLPLYFDEDLSNQELLACVKKMGPDIIYSFYYRNILPEKIIGFPPLGAFNLHGSLLPRYRGRCPVNWVIINREKVTGVTLHRMEKEPDAGDIVAQKTVIIDPRETAITLFKKIIPEAAALVLVSHPLIREGRATLKPQDSSAATVFPGRHPSDGKIDWTRDALDIDALVRAVTKPYPGAFTYLKGRKVFIWESLPEDGLRNHNPGLIQSVAPFKVTAGKGILNILTAEYENGEIVSHDGRNINKGMKEGQLFE
jgi:methionyl-tRNA formyltransferase